MEKTKVITHIGLTLENGEQIWFKVQDLMHYELEIGHDKMVLIGDEFIQFPQVRYLEMTVNACANHTYNSFGRASEQSAFNRLIDEEDVAALVIRTDDTDYTYYCREDMGVIAELDAVGNLDITIIDPDDTIEYPCDCEFGCECDCCEADCC